MSKPKRDIKLGEMQDECRERSGACIEGSGRCKYLDVCMFHKGTRMQYIDLTDPPRFSDEAMAFFRGLYAIGAKQIMWNTEKYMFCAVDMSKDVFNTLGYIVMLKGKELGLDIGETLDLAELLEKDGAR